MPPLETRKTHGGMRYQPERIPPCVVDSPLRSGTLLPHPLTTSGQIGPKCVLTDCNQCINKIDLFAISAYNYINRLGVRREVNE